MEIGSIYELNPALCKDGLTKPTEPLRLGEAEKYNKKYVRYTASGREAIALALRSYESGHPQAVKRCLLPAYMCDCVFFPFERAGWELQFYHIDRNLEANIEELDRLIEQIEPSLIFVHPYYGVDTWNSVRPLFHRWRAQGVCIIEDVTQSYYLGNAGVEADYCVGSLRKWYAVPDGGFVASDEELPETGHATNEEFVREKGALLRCKWAYLYGQMDEEKRRAIKAEYLQKNREMEEWLDAYDGISGMSAESMQLLSRINEKECADRRKENCAYLHKNMAGRTQVRPVFAANDKKEAFGEDGESGETAFWKETGRSGIMDAAPLYYPVYARDRDELQRFLALRGIYAPTLWPVGEENAGSLSQDERYIFEHLLALPMDQRYGIREMQRVLEVLDQYEAEQNGSEASRSLIEGWENTATDGRLEKREGTAAGGQAENRKGIAADRRPERQAGQLIGIRVDANDTIATGHVMRCITIAKKLLAAGSRVIFYTADEYAAELLEQNGMRYVCLHTRWDDMEREIPLLRKELEKAGCTKLLVDSYQVNVQYFEGLHDLCKLIYIDDCFEEIYPVDMLINYNAYHVRFPYKDVYEGRTKLLLGTSYVPLREEFSDGGDGGTYADSCHDNYSGGAVDTASYGGTASVCGEITQDHIDVSQNTDGTPHILLSSGGGDLYNAMAGILRTAMRDEAMREAVFHVVVGGFNRNAEELRELAGKYPNIRLHERVEHMARLMRSCQAAVSAAGTMLFELSATQTPTVFFVSADNQQYDHEFFAQDGRMLYAGDIRADRDGCLGKICGQLQQLLEHKDMREQMKRKLHEVTDGNGAQRIAAEILRL